MSLWRKRKAFCFSVLCSKCVKAWKYERTWLVREHRGMPLGSQFHWDKRKQAANVKFESSSSVKSAFSLFDVGNNNYSDKTNIQAIFPWFSKVTWRNTVTDSGSLDVDFSLRHYLFYVIEPTQHILLTVCRSRIDHQLCYNSVELIWECF